jgi:hypothetical protein
MKPPGDDRSFKVNRRKFWKHLMQEFFVTRGSIKGGQGFRLTDLKNLPDKKLAQIKPVLNSDWEIFEEEGQILGRYKDGQKALKLFPVKKEIKIILELFNGQDSLEDISEQLIKKMQWDKSTSFSFSRDIFLLLAQNLIYVPRDPLET